ARGRRKGARVPRHEPPAESRIRPPRGLSGECKVSLDCLGFMRPSLRPVVQLAAFCAAMFFVRASFADHYKVPSGSMEPTVKTGDHVVVNKAAYGIRIPTTSDWVVRYGDPQRGDIVVLEADEPTILLKRVVAVGGDTVEVKNGQVFIDGLMNDVRVE